MLTCDKCGAKGFITVEEDEFHCVLCGFVWYLEKSTGQVPGEAGSERRSARSGRRIPRQRRSHGQE